MPRHALAASVLCTLVLAACPSPPEPPPGPSSSQMGGPAGPANPAAPSNGPQGQQPPTGSRQPDAQKPGPVGSKTPSANPTGPPVPPAEGPHAGEFNPNAGKGTDADPLAQDLRLVPPQLSQQTIREGAHYTLAGTVSGTCDGTLRIDVLEEQSAPPAPGTAPPGPLASTDLSGPGDFSVVVPKGKKVFLSAVCDSDGDGVVSGNEPISEPGGAEGLSSSKSGITLKLTNPGG